MANGRRCRCAQSEAEVSTCRTAAFRLTDDDVEIIRVVGKRRLVRSIDIAVLIGRSLDRTNDRLERLFHAGYVDRPRAQLDYYPTIGSGPMIYAIADRGVRLIHERDGVTFRNPEWSRKNRKAGRPFIEHQIEIVNFEVALQRAVAERRDLRIVAAEDMNAAAPRQQMPAGGGAFALRAKVTRRGTLHETSVIPDIVFGIQPAKGARHNFMVEIDRGTMPVRRSDPRRTSFAGKMHTYLAAHAGKHHERLFGWKNFRVLTVTTDPYRLNTMQSAARELAVSRSIGASLFLFATYADFHASSPLDHGWLDGSGRATSLH